MNFEPRSLFLKNPHLQTAMAGFSLGMREPNVSLPLQISIAKGAGKLVGIAHLQESILMQKAEELPLKEEPLIVLVHGVGGSQDSAYVKRAAMALFSVGYNVVRISLRGAYGLEPNVPNLYHLGLTRDLNDVVKSLYERFKRPLFLMGFSGGGNLSLKLAGEWGKKVPPYVLGVASLSAPLSIREAALNLEKSKYFTYRYHLLKGLKKGVEAIYKTGESPFSKDEYEKAMETHSLREYDEIVTAKPFGFDSAEDYWEKASSKHVLSNIEVPTLLLHSKDDPMVPICAVEPYVHLASKYVQVKISSYGGHVEWLNSYTPFELEYTWAVEQCLSFFAKCAQTFALAQESYASSLAQGKSVHHEI